MTHFTIYNAAGEILRSGQCSDGDVDAQAGEGEFVLRAESNPETDRVDPVTQTLIPNGKPPPPVDMDYQRARMDVYPSVGEQLDMLWHAMDSNQMQRLEPFYSTIKAIKDAYPKDNSVVPGSVVIYTVDS